MADRILSLRDFRNTLRCPSCDGAKSLALPGQPGAFPAFEDVPSGRVRLAEDVREQRRILVCSQCGLWFCSHSLEPGVETELFDSPLYAVSHRPDAARLTFPRAYRLLSTRGVVPGSALDVGACSGEFLRGLGPGWRSYALEPGSYSRETLSFADGVFSGRMDDSNPIDRTFDIVTMFDVAEHLLSVRRAFANLARWLKPNGLAIIESGDAGSRPAAKLGARWPYAHYLSHTVVFSRESLAYAAGLHNLEISTWTSVAHARRTPAKLVALGLKLAAYAGLRILPRVDHERVWKQISNRLGRTGGIPTLPWRDHFLAVVRHRG